MASVCNRLAQRTSLSSIRSSIKFISSKSSPSTSSRFSLPPKHPPSPSHRFSFNRSPSELGCIQSLLPLHSAVAIARMTSCLSTTSRSCRALSQGTLCRTYPGL